jgi:hypothetical protein
MLYRKENMLKLMQLPRVKKFNPFKLIISPAQGENIILLTRGEMISLSGLRFSGNKTIVPIAKLKKGVAPAKAGVQKFLKILVSRFRGNDNPGLLQLDQLYWDDSKLIRYTQ